MVDRLRAGGWLRSARVEAAFRAVPRHLFLPGAELERVYSGEAIITRTGDDGMPLSSSSEPAVMACMLEQLELAEGRAVLEIGAGSGYNAALLAWLVGEAGEVATIDIDLGVAAQARANLAAAGFGRVQVRAADGWLGASDRAPFDAIEVTVGVWDLSPDWVAQLREGGTLVAPLWLRAGVQACVAFRRDGERLRSASVRGCGFMRLRGPHAGPEAYVPVDGWRLSTDDARAARTDVLAELLALVPREEAAPELPAERIAGFLLGAFGAVSLFDQARGHGMVGIFDAAARSLAVLDRRGTERPARILVFGADDALVRLRAALDAAPSLRLEALGIEAVPAGSSRAGTGALVLRRPKYDLLLFEEGA